jgi:putative membrane protein
MKKAIVLTSVLSVAGLAGLSAASTPAGSAPQQLQQHPAATGALNKQDTDFFEDAAQGGMLEVKLGELAVKQGASDDVRKFGQRMVDDHGKLNTRLTDLGHQKPGLTVPAELDKKHKAVVDKMAQLSGAKFDREYMDSMVDDHQKDVKAFEKQAKEGKDPDLKQLAATSLPMLLEHLQLAKDVDARVKK